MSFDMNNLNQTVRLNKTNYNRPKTTINDTLQEPDAYKEKLKGYTEVTDINYVEINSHVRYFIYNLSENKWKFRTGGFLKKIAPKYIILSNGRHTWSVQREINDENSGDIWETKFFKILSKVELSEIALEKQQDEIEKLRAENQVLKQQIYSINYN